MAALQSLLDPAFVRSLAMHTGIASGLVVARRSDSRGGDFVLTGDAVNMAARLRSAAASREVVVGATTWQQVSDAFEAEATKLSSRIAEGGGSPRHEIWRTLVLAALGGLCVEVWMTRRMARTRGLA